MGRVSSQNEAIIHLGLVQVKDDGYARKVPCWMANLPVVQEMLANPRLFWVKKGNSVTPEVETKVRTMFLQAVIARPRRGRGNPVLLKSEIATPQEKHLRFAMTNFCFGCPNSCPNASVTPLDNS